MTAPETVRLAVDLFCRLSHYCCAIFLNPMAFTPPSGSGSSPLWPSSVSSESQSVKSSLCSQDNDVYCVLKLGEIYRYTIPSFSVITVYLRHARVQTEDDHGTIDVLDVFFHDETNKFFDIRVPAEVKVFESCVVEVAEFANEVKQVQTMKLRCDGVLVIWKWDWVAHSEKQEDSESCDSTRSPSVGAEEETGGEEEESEDTGPSDSSSCTPNITHAITFKCIGAVRDKISQHTLRVVRARMDKGYTVPVKLQPEPDNFWDPKAIAFMCNVDDKWTRIGYVVSELADEVHEAITKNLIISVKFSWVKFMTKWEHGMYAGIEIKRNGQWSSKVMAKRSA